MLRKIGVIGDVHAEDVHLEQAITTLLRHDAEILVCTGDITDGPGNLARCVELLTDYDVATVRGNHDRWVLQHKARHIPHAHMLDELDPDVVQFLKNLPISLTLDTAVGQLLLCHSVADNDLQKVWPGTERMPAERSERLDQIIADNRYRWMINGHVHYRTIIHFEQMPLTIAGTLMNRHRPGFSLLDLDEHTITGFEFAEATTPQVVKQQPLLPDHETDIFRDTSHFRGDWAPKTLYA